MTGEPPVALVSGTSRGIGAEIARQLAADHGFLVLAGARNPGDVEAGEGLVPVALDVTDQAGVDAARERVEADPGRLDVLVNNAGVYGEPIGVVDYDLENAHRVLEVNLFGPWRLIQAFMPLLRGSEDPRIVNLSSGAGQLSDMNGGRAAYRVSKTGLNALTRALAADESGRIRVNTMCPGWVRTDMGGRGAPRSVADGADTAVWLATDPGVGSGGFYRDRRPIPW
ncbi:MAG TPA: SDR family NAD(P)-dependent oxidoreductase [Solirubrobacterales bacterium]|jgi:NAD(P)-dependent dehydrogenase (short-subunit alcohol dehydrogenase family)|nr:SDR family NAD(P)-dependent oxidoreductase [Solirubrobacterales bacterium]